MRDGPAAFLTIAMLVSRARERERERRESKKNIRVPEAGDNDRCRAIARMLID